MPYAVTIQIPSIILPQTWSVGTETESIADVAEHTSIEINVANALQEKCIYIVATEIVTAGVPGPLWYWVELSPYGVADSSAYWAAIGGGGGAIAPTSPGIEVGTGTNLTVHTMLVAWTIHAPFARLIVQTPVNVATASWVVQALFGGKY